MTDSHNLPPQDVYAMCERRTAMESSSVSGTSSHSQGTVNQLMRKKVKLAGGKKQSAIDDDVLRHAERRLS
jgi:hypothetical protein